MPNTLSPETALEVAAARGDAWKGVAADLCEILQSVVEALMPSDPQAATAIAKVAIGPIEKGNLLAASEELGAQGYYEDAANHDAGSVRLGSDELEVR